MRTHWANNRPVPVMGVVLLAASAFSQPQVSGLENGLKVCAIEDTSCDVVTVQLLLTVTADCEPPDKAGLRTVLQHAIRASWDQRIGADDKLAFIRDMEDVRGGLSINTDWDYVAFGYAGIPDTLPSALEFLAEGVFEPELTEELHQSTVKLVMEAASGPQSAPAESTYALFREALLGSVPRAYVLGKPETVEQISLADLRTFHRRFYTPGLATLCVLGPVPAADVVSLATDAFGAIPSTDAAVPEPPTPPADPVTRAQSNPGLSVGHMPQLEIASMVVGVPSPGGSDPDLPVAYVIRALLGADGQRTGRLDLDDELWAALGLPFPVARARDSQFIETLPPPVAALGHLAVHVYANPREVEEVRRELLAHFHRLAEEAPDSEEVEAAKEYVTNGYVLLFESPATRAQLAARGVALGVTAPLGREFAERVAQVTPDDVQRVADQFFDRYAVAVEFPQSVE